MRWGPPSHRTSRAPVGRCQADELRGRGLMAGPDGLDPGVGCRPGRPEPFGPGWRRGEDHRHVGRRQAGVSEVEIAARGGHDGRRLRRPDPERPPPRLERRGGALVDASRRPLVRRCGPHGARPDEHHVRHRPQQAHHEPVGIEEPAHLAATRAAVCVEGDDAVDRRDEVGDDRRPVGTQVHPQLAVVAVVQLGWEESATAVSRDPPGRRPAGRRAAAGRFPQPLEPWAASAVRGRSRLGPAHDPERRRPLTS